MSACIGHTLSGNVLFSEGLLLDHRGNRAQLGTLTKITGCSNHSDKTEGVRLTEVVNRDREPRSDQRHTKAEEEHPPARWFVHIQKTWVEWSYQVHKEWLLMKRLSERAPNSDQPRLYQIGGSHAQRDLFEQVYLDAWLLKNEALHLLKSALQPVVTFPSPCLPCFPQRTLLSWSALRQFRYAPNRSSIAEQTS